MPSCQLTLIYLFCVMFRSSLIAHSMARFYTLYPIPISTRLPMTPCIFHTFHQPTPSLILFLTVDLYGGILLSGARWALKSNV